LSGNGCVAPVHPSCEYIVCQLGESGLYGLELPTRLIPTATRLSSTTSFGVLRIVGPTKTA
jgi:hypothetical protein